MVMFFRSCKRAENKRRFGFGRSINLSESWEHLAAADHQFRTSDPADPYLFALRAATLRYAKDLINRILSTKIVARTGFEFCGYESDGFANQKSVGR